MDLEDRAAIEAVHYKYIEAVDTGDPDAFVALRTRRDGYHRYDGGGRTRRTPPVR